MAIVDISAQDISDFLYYHTPRIVESFDLGEKHYDIECQVPDFFPDIYPDIANNDRSHQFIIPKLQQFLDSQNEPVEWIKLDFHPDGFQIEIPGTNGCYINIGFSHGRYIYTHNIETWVQCHILWVSLSIVLSAIYNYLSSELETEHREKSPDTEIIIKKNPLTMPFRIFRILDCDGYVIAHAYTRSTDEVKSLAIKNHLGWEKIDLKLEDAMLFSAVRKHRVRLVYSEGDLIEEEILEVLGSSVEDVCQKVHDACNLSPRLFGIIRIEIAGDPNGEFLTGRILTPTAHPF